MVGVGVINSFVGVGVGVVAIVGVVFLVELTTITVHILGGPPTLLRSPDAPCPQASSATTSSSVHGDDSKRNDGDSWNSGDFVLDNMFNAAEASGTGDNEEEEGNLDVS